MACHEVFQEVVQDAIFPRKFECPANSNWTLAYHAGDAAT